jgi:hypothetical protein
MGIPPVPIPRLFGRGYLIKHMRLPRQECRRICFIRFARRSRSKKGKALIFPAAAGAHIAKQCISAPFGIFVPPQVCEHPKTSVRFGRRNPPKRTRKNTCICASTFYNQYEYIGVECAPKMRKGRLRMTEYEAQRLQKITERIAEMKARQQAIIAKDKQRQRKERTRRLIQNGALAEKYLCCEGMAPGEFERMLKVFAEKIKEEN